MPNIGPTEFIRASLTIVFLCTLWAMFVAWIWLIWRFFTGQPILPESPMVRRRETPWGVGTVLVVFVPLLATQVDISQWVRKAAPPPPAYTHEKNVRPVTVPAKDDPPRQSPPAGPASEIELGRDDVRAVKMPGNEKKVPLSRTMLLTAVMQISRRMLLFRW